MKNLDSKFQRIKRARQHKPVDVLLNKQFLKENRDENIKYWVHEINVLHNEGYKKHFPETDPYDSLEFDEIAIVGNSGSLIDQGLGDKIDEHEKVLRFNTAPTTGYTDDVGFKTSFRFSIGTLTYRSGGENLIRSYRRNRQAVKDKDGPLNESWHLIHTHRFGHWVQDFKDTDSGNDVCSTGFLGVFFGILLSKKVNLYGFKLPNDENDFKYHYYNDSSYVERSHKFKQEHSLYNYLDQNTDWFNWKEV